MIKKFDYNQPEKPYNPKKFSVGYIIEIDKSEHPALRSKISTLKTGGRGEHSKYAPKAFTEKGLYMRHYIEKREGDKDNDIYHRRIHKIEETITDYRGKLSANPDKYAQKSFMEKSGEDMQTSKTETEIELNFTVLKLKHTIKKKDKGK